MKNRYRKWTEIKKKLKCKGQVRVVMYVYVAPHSGIWLTKEIL